MLAQRKQDGRCDAKFDGLETKLLYTIHWIILDAASECEDMDAEKYGGVSLGEWHWGRICGMLLVCVCVCVCVCV